MSDGFESGALLLSSAARHIDFYFFAPYLYRPCSAFHNAFTKTVYRIFNICLIVSVMSVKNIDNFIVLYISQYPYLLSFEHLNIRYW